MTAVAARRWAAVPWAPMLAAALASVAVLAQLRGVDLPAQLYRVGLFHREGLTLWDSQWYGGHWTLNYSVIFPPLAGIAGVPLTEVASACLASLMFDRLVVHHFGPTARAGSIVFAVSTLAEVAIGQLPYLLGESLALAALWALARGHRRAALALAAGASLASPLAGAFLALAALAWALASSVRRGAGWRVLTAALAPVGLLAIIFPGQGTMPFPLLDCLFLLALAGCLMLLLPAGERMLRCGAALYLLAISLSVAIPTPVGGNISRLAESVGAALAVCLLWPQRGPRRLLLAALAVALASLQWGPALASFTSNPGDPSTHARYFRPLLAFLGQHAVPVARVEVVPTKLHWEAAYVAPHIPLARGWERQLDTADNAIFYNDGALTATSYRAWLLASGVRYVALAGVPLDYAAAAEGRLLDRGIPGLRLAWRDASWRVYEVTGASGIVAGAAQVVRASAREVTVRASAPGDILVRVRYSPRWSLVQGQGCVAQGASGWTTIRGAAAGALTLRLRLLGQGSACAAS
ncbi:MAG: hypothetical protein ACR2ND_05705 [Solirubrobacteraceae bacterium]